MPIEDELKRVEITLVKLEERLHNISSSVNEIKTKMETKYVSNDEFRPIRLIVYGLMGMLGVSVITSVISLVIK